MAEKVFMGWNRSLVQSSASWLSTRFRTSELGGGIDLQLALIVVPGRRFGRQLLAELVDIGDRQRAWVSPGRIITPGEVCAALLGERTRAASGFARAMSWACVLRASDRSEFETLFHRRPNDEALAEWLRLGSLLDSTVGELARELILPGEVPHRCEPLRHTDDARKWGTIERLRGAYERILAEAETFDAHLFHLERLRSGQTSATGRLTDVVLVGVVELDSASRAAIDQSGLRSAALIFGPESEDRWLDPFGCVRRDCERDRISLRSDSIEFSPDIADAAHRAIGRIAAWTNERTGMTPRDVSVCAPEPAVAEELRLAAKCVEGLRFHDASGEEVGRSPVVKFLAALCELLRENTAEALAKFIKRPEVEKRVGAALGSGIEWITEMDALAVMSPATPIPSLTGQAGAIAREVERLVGPPLFGERSTTQIDSQFEGLLSVLENMFGEDELPPREAEVLAVIADALAELRNAHAIIGPVVCWRAFELLIEAIRDERIAAQSHRGEVEVLGWLEAAADRAPCIVITGLNEGWIPRGRVEDSLLPEAVRASLGMATGQSRAERDAFLLEGMVQSRETSGGIWAICARQDGEGNPLRPSRLLFRCEDAQALNRIERMVDEVPEVARFAVQPAVKEPGAAGLHGAFPLAPMHDMAPPRAVRATAFREYIRSPYVFFLKHVARLEEIDEPAPEVDHSSMGSLLHRVLADFGTSEARTSKDRDTIAEWVLGRLEQLTGDMPLRRISSVRDVQIEVAKRRLRMFAKLQAEHAADGWSIHATEWESPTPVEIVAPSGRVRLSGRVDRIDRRGDEWLVLDYKTGDSGKTPDKSHIAKKQWVDLQLPLYSYMLKANGLAPRGARVGFVVLPRRSDDGAIELAEWDDTQHAEAEALATQIVEDILNGRFPLGDDPFERGAIGRLCGITLLDVEPGESAE